MKVYYGRKSCLSGRILQRELRDIEGPSINFGYQRGGEINSSAAVKLASNKRLAFKAMADAGVPIPEFYGRGSVHPIDADGRLFKPVIGRPDKHYGGSHFYLCRSEREMWQATQAGCTHFTEYIEGGREFRCHVAFGKSIKIAEKVGGDDVIRNFNYGSTFVYPQDFNHKKSLRRVAREAVMSLGLDFGAVDVIYKDGEYYVLEVNTAPSLTSASNTLERYVAAFKNITRDNAWN